MERSHLVYRPNQKRAKRLVRAAILILLGISQPTVLNLATANVVLTEPSPPEAMSADQYPDSQFGKPPADPVTGQLPLMALEKAHVARQVADIDAQAMSTGRSPAGLNFANATAKVQTTDLPAPGAAQDPNPNPNSSVFGQKPVIPSSSEMANYLGFFPRAVFVTRDVPVRIFVTGASKSTLCLMIDAFNIRKQVRTQKIEEITFTPSVPGTYRYYCPVNGMEGTLVVRELGNTREEVASAPTEGN